MTILTWSADTGRVGDNTILMDIETKPDLPFPFSALYYEPDTNMRLVITPEGKQRPLTDAECAACESAVATLLEMADYPVFAHDEDGVFRGLLSKNEALEKGLSWRLEAPDHPASKWADGAWRHVVAVIMDNGVLREMPAEICQLCLLTFTQEEWDAFPSRPATAYQTWDFASETWKDKRGLPETVSEAKALARRVAEEVRQQLLDAVPELERLTWMKQEQESRAWLADSTSPTPFIDIILESAAQDKAALCQAIVAQAEKAWHKLARAHVLQQQWFAEITACRTPPEVDDVVFSFSGKPLDDLVRECAEG